MKNSRLPSAPAMGESHWTIAGEAERSGEACDLLADAPVQFGVAHDALLGVRARQLELGLDQSDDVRRPGRQRESRPAGRASTR